MRERERERERETKVSPSNAVVLHADSIKYSYVFSVHEVFVGEATDDSTLNGVMDGMDAVVSCLGNRTFKSRPTVWAVDRDANLNLVKRAAKAKVGRFVFVSVFEGHKVRSKIPQIEAREQ